jgi:hypothetical protein
MKIPASSLLLFLPLLGAAQEKDADPQPSFSNSVSVSANQPLGEFSETHSIGVSARYSRQAARVMKIRKKSPGGIGLIYGGGLGWNKGKKEWLNGYGYRYGDLLHAYVMGGINYRFLNIAEAGLSLGPGVTRYRSVNRFNLYGGLYTSVHFKGNLGVEGGLDFLKENKAAWMAMARIGAVYRF